MLAIILERTRLIRVAESEYVLEVARGGSDERMGIRTLWSGVRHTDILKACIAPRTSKRSSYEDGRVGLSGWRRRRSDATFTRPISAARYDSSPRESPSGQRRRQLNHAPLPRQHQKQELHNLDICSPVAVSPQPARSPSAWDANMVVTLKPGAGGDLSQR